MFPPLRVLQADCPDGIEGEILAVNHVCRTDTEIKAKVPTYHIVFVLVEDITYCDVVEVEDHEDDTLLGKGNKVSVTWRTTKEGDGKPLLKKA